MGAATAATVVKTVGRRSRRQLGERVHFCVRCDFPIAVYGRLVEHEDALKFQALVFFTTLSSVAMIGFLGSMIYRAPASMPSASIVPGVIQSAICKEMSDLAYANKHMSY
ncbi:hypothetical protein GH714_008624 [Hevea brasiliensis]|uniref:Uncharacterized protein n=1 Tax=Hevea brasiliensis TaxID=3981 RepID=A0A6A6KIJ3_HEVBR|nr:hypothetical protein GH714_008624 [Hevea brasiliensis]